MTDYRERLTNELEVLLQTLDVDDIPMISDGFVKILSQYEVTERCTDIIVLDDENEKLLKRYKACLSIDGKSKNTISQYIRECKKLADMLGKPYTEMGTYDIRYYLATEKDRGISNVSLENSRAYISAFFQWLTNEEIIPKNPTLKIKTIKCKKELKQPFSDVEIDALKGACKTAKERAIIELLLTSGIRVSELCGMKVKDIDFQTLEVHVVEGKGDKERMTYITAVSAKHIKDYLDQRKEDGEYLFYNKNHEPLKPGGVRYILETIGKKAGVGNVHPHRFRRTFATGLANRGMRVQDIQALLGHSRIETTMAYISKDTNKVKMAYNQYIV